MASPKLPKTKATAPIRAAITPISGDSPPIRVIQHHSTGHPGIPPAGTFLMPFPILEIRLEVQADGPCLHAYLGDHHPAVSDWQIRKWFASGYQLSGIPPLHYGITQQVTLTHEKQLEPPAATPELQLFHQPDWWNHILKEEVPRYPTEVFGWDRPLDGILLGQLVLIHWPEFAGEILARISKVTSPPQINLASYEKLRPTCLLLNPETIINRIKKPLVEMEVWRQPATVTRKLFTKDNAGQIWLKTDLGLLRSYQTATQHGTEPGASEIEFLELLNAAAIHPSCQQQLPPEWFLHHPEADIEELSFTYPNGPAPSHRQSWLKCPRQRQAALKLLQRITAETMLAMGDHRFKQQTKALRTANCIPAHWAEHPECASRILRDATLEEIRELLKQQPALLSAMKSADQGGEKLRELLSSQI